VGNPPPPPTVDVPAVGKQVVGLLRDQWNTSDALREYGITVDDGMTLINTDLNKYDGLATVRRAGAAGLVLVRADSAYYGFDIINVCRRVGARFSVTARLTPSVVRAIAQYASPTCCTDPPPLPTRWTPEPQAVQ